MDFTSLPFFHTAPELRGHVCTVRQLNAFSNAAASTVRMASPDGTLIAGSLLRENDDSAWFVRTGRRPLTNGTLRLVPFSFLFLLHRRPVLLASSWYSLPPLPSPPPSSSSTPLPSPPAPSPPPLPFSASSSPASPFFFSFPRLLPLPITITTFSISKRRAVQSIPKPRSGRNRYNTTQERSEQVKHNAGEL